jgi:ribonuclease D
MTINPNNIPPPLFIKDQQQFAQALDDLARQDTLAVDTEANSLYAYQEQVCLIQISTRERDYILDPLTIPNLTPLGDIFWDPEIEKIFHASEYDILILYEDFQFEFQNLFDTMITAQILGRKKLGYDSLLEEIYGVKISKKYQRANWGKRPLSEEMLHYAQVDTHYLIGIREVLGEELQRSRLEPIAREDFQRAARVHLEDRAEKLAPCWRINGARQLPPQKAAVLQKLSELRDQMARELDRPLFKVMSTKTLLILAENSPTSRKELNRLQVAKQRNIQRFAEGILAAVREGLQAEPMRPPRRKRPDEDFINREKALKQWRKHTARRMNVNSAVVLPRTLLDNLAAENPRTQEQLARVLQEVPWRLEQFGDEILRVLNKAS